MDHAWSFTCIRRTDLEVSPELRRRMYAAWLHEAVHGREATDDDAAAGAAPADDEQEEETTAAAATELPDLANATDLDLDERGITSLQSLRLSVVAPQLTALSLWGNAISDPADVVAAVQGLSELRALWLNGNPVAERSAEYEQRVLEACPKLEILDSKFTSRCVFNARMRSFAKVRLMCVVALQIHGVGRHACAQSEGVP